MKILKLRFKNLNSLYGEWEIDFTSPEYIDNGIFAIVGPTGAGKSTILDAISLALYGRTPRLTVVSSSTNEVMSRGTGECSAEVFFEVEGCEYSAHWSQRRARKSATGKLQGNKHKLDNVTLGKAVTEKINQTKASIEELTGMSFDQFTRSMLLAQGEFSKFLKASTNERSEILEKITDTSIYSEISIAVHQKKKFEDEKLLKLEAGIESVLLLADDEVKVLEDQLVEHEAQKTKLVGEEEKLRTLKNAYERILELTKEFALIEDEEGTLDKAVENFSADNERLQLGELVEKIWGDYKVLQGVRKLQCDELALLKTLESDLPAKQKLFSVEDENFKRVQKESAAVRLQQSSELALIKNVREIDAHLKVLNSSSNTLSVEKNAVNTTILKYKDELLKQHELIRSSKMEIKRVDCYLDEHRSDKTLEREINSILDGLRRIYREQREIGALEASLPKVEATCRTAEEKYKTSLSAKADAEELVKESESRCSGIQNKVDDTLKGKCLADIEQELLEQVAHYKKLDEVGASYKIMEETEKNIIVYEKKLFRSFAELDRFEGKLEKFNAEMVDVEKEIEHLEVETQLADRIMTLESRRNELSAGDACPLCGSLDHPYVTEGLPHVSEFQVKLVEAKDKRNFVQKEIIKCTEGVAKVSTEVQGVDGILEVEKSKYMKINFELSDLLVEAGIENTGSGFGDKIEKQKHDINLKITLLEKELSSIKKYQNELATEKDNSAKNKDVLITIEKTLGELNVTFTAAEAEYNNAKESFESIKQQFQDTANEILVLLNKFGVYELSEVCHEQEKIAKELKHRNEKFITYSEKRVESQSVFDLAQAKVEELEKILEREEERLGKITLDENNNLVDLQEYKDKRASLYGDKDCDEQEQSFADLVLLAESKLDIGREQLKKVENDVAELKIQIENAQRTTSHRCGELEKLEIEFADKRNEFDFNSEELFLSAKLDGLELERLRSIKTELGEMRHNLMGKRESNRADYSKVSTKVSREDSEDVITVKLSNILESKNTLLQNIGSLIKQLKSNEEAQILYSSKKDDIVSQQEACRKVNNLHELIGSADGKKYRNFAQGLTFDVMLRYANVELEKMSDRYLLRRAENKAGASAELLDLDVLDKDQAGEIRSTKNLSGGESFIVSLALALGLSRMSSKKVQVNSLFLDEGFGTLDEDELDKTLSALSRLQQQGKLIGVISHVTALKERIGLQIGVERVADGKSVLIGQGCRQL